MKLELTDWVGRELEVPQPPMAHGGIYHAVWWGYEIGFDPEVVANQTMDYLLVIADKFQEETLRDVP